MKAEERVENESIEEKFDVDFIEIDDLRLISSLLTEYSDKLQAISTKRLKLQKELKLFQLLLSLVTVILTLYTLLHKTNNKIFDFNSLYFFYLPLLSLPSPLAFLAFLAPFLFLYFCLFYLLHLKTKIRESNKRDKRIALRLERLVQIGSQLYEAKNYWGEAYRPIQVISRIELDFCLADAEAALEAFADLNKRNK